jgi:hypothetical protein
MRVGGSRVVCAAAEENPDVIGTPMQCSYSWHKDCVFTFTCLRVRLSSAGATSAMQNVANALRTGRDSAAAPCYGSLLVGQLHCLSRQHKRYCLALAGHKVGPHFVLFVA